MTIQSPLHDANALRAPTTACPSLDEIAAVVKGALREANNNRVQAENAQFEEGVKVFAFSFLATCLAIFGLIMTYEDDAYGPDAFYFIDMFPRFLRRGVEKPTMLSRDPKCATSVAYHTLRDQVEMGVRVAVGVGVIAFMWLLLFG